MYIYVYIFARSKKLINKHAYIHEHVKTAQRPLPASSFATCVEVLPVFFESAYTFFTMLCTELSNSKSKWR